MIQSDIKQGDTCCTEKKKLILLEAREEIYKILWENKLDFG